MKKFTFNDLRTSLEKTPSLSENADAVKTLVGSVAVLLGDTATGNVYTHNSEYLPKLRAASRQPWLSILSNPVR